MYIILSRKLGCPYFLVLLIPTFDKWKQSLKLRNFVDDISNSSFQHRILAHKNITVASHTFTDFLNKIVC